MFIREKKSNRILRSVFKTVILAAGCYSIFAMYILKKHNDIYLWGAILAIIGAFIFDRVTFKGYSQMEYFEGQREERKQKKELWIIAGLFLLIVIIGLLAYLLDWK